MLPGVISCSLLSKSVKSYMTDLKFDKTLYDHVVQYYDYMWMKNQGVDVMKLFPDLPFG